MKTLKWLDDNIEKALGSVLLAIATIIIALQIIFRWTSILPLDWTEEIARYLFVWIIYIGVAYGVKQRAHISVEILTVFAKPRGKFILAMISNVLFFIFALVISYHGILLLGKITKFWQTSPAVKVPMVIPYSSYVLGFILVMVRLIQDSILRIKEEKLRILSLKEEEK